MLKLRTDIKYISPEGKLTQAGVEAFQGQIDALSADPSGLTVSSFAASAIVTEAEGIAANDVDTALPTSAAVKDYADAVAKFTWLASQSTTSGTSKVFSGIPAGVSEVVVLLRGVSVSGTNSVLVRLGDAGGIETTGYDSDGAYGGVTATSTVGLIMRLGSGGRTHLGAMLLFRPTGNEWVAMHSTGFSNGGGTKTLSDTMTQLEILPDGADTFDAGSVIVGYR